MVDTIRSLASLKTIMADNNTNNITPQNERDFLVSVDPENAVQTGALASAPAAQKGGFLYACNDAPYLIRDTGAAQEVWGPFFKMTLPIDGNYAWLNQGSATVTVNGSIHLASPGASADNLRVRLKNAPATPYNISAYIRGFSYPGSSGFFGLCFSDGTKIMTFGLGTVSTGGQRNQFSKWNSATSFSTNYLDNPSLCDFSGWMRISDNGTNRICSFSPDGFNWIQAHSVGNTDFLTATKVGFYVQTNVGAANFVGCTLYSWKET
jgi:hypothetical protein